MKRNANNEQNRRRPSAPQEYDQKVLDIARVARVTAGGRRFSFRATVVVGNKKGKVGVGVAKGRDVAVAIEKSTRKAKKNIITVPMTPNGSIPYDTIGKQTSAVVFLKPARLGRGIIAGGAVRVVCDLAGYKDISGKILGRSGNKLNNALATLNALEKIRYEAPEKKTEKKEIKKSVKKKEVKEQIKGTQIAKGKSQITKSKSSSK